MATFTVGAGPRMVSRKHILSNNMYDYANIYIYIFMCIWTYIYMCNLIFYVFYTYIFICISMNMYIGIKDTLDCCVVTASTLYIHIYMYICTCTVYIMIYSHINVCLYL
jgi:hypothetical protein